MNTTTHLKSLIALGFSAAFLALQSLPAQEVSSAQLLKEIQALRSTVASQQKLIEDLQTKVEGTIASKETIKSELTEEFKQTFASQQPESGVVADSWFNQVEMYGRFHGSFDVLDNGTHLSGNSSRIGFRGDESIDDDLSAVWQLEISINLDEGGTSTLFKLRDTFVGFNESTYGSLLVGRMDSAFERLHRWTDFFDSQIGDSRNIVGYNDPTSNGFDNREDNSIKYISPEMGGFTGMVSYTAAEGEQSDSTLAANLAFRDGDGLMLAAAAIVQGEGNVAGPEKEIGFRFAGSYEWEKLKISGIFEYLDNLGGVDGVDQTAGGFGAAYKISDKNTVKGQVRHASGIGKDDESTGYAFGIDHSLSERTRVYLGYALTVNGASANNGVTGGGHGTTVTPSVGDDSSGFSIGVVHGW